MDGDAGTDHGRVIGGPIGGALGALAGQAIDGRLFRGAARDGPRLTELAVQTSSYGTPIPRLFGTIRVAGTVIWSTDLIETRTTNRAGKGQPGTNSYSYSASFAVALSARPILGVRRIWAEGKLLRGAGGDWKARTGFRLHLGGEDQAVDPLIASAMGTTPAYRGIAYGVFEGLDLTDYGNRIPSLTFEVQADAGAVASGAIAAALADEVVPTGMAAAGAGTMIEGFAAAGASVRGVLDTLTTIDGGWWQTDGARLVRRSDAGAARIVADAGVGIGRSGRRGVRAIAAAASVPREVTVAHHDPARDYQIGVQRARRSGAGGRVDRIKLPAVLGSAAAKGVAAALLTRGEAERTRRRVALGIDGLDIAPGAIVGIAGEAGRWRVAASSVEGMVTTLDLLPLARAPLPVPASSGRVIAAPDHRIGRTRLVIGEWPALEEAPLAGPRVSVIANGESVGWRQAALLYSLDEGASWTAAGATASPAPLGRVIEPPAAAAPWLVDKRSRLVVMLDRDDMMLGDADAVSLARGENLALVGGELIQFGRAQALGNGRWALSDLRRGLRGSEAAIAEQAAGARFAMIERGGVATIDLPAAAIGRRVRILASGIGDPDVPAEAAMIVTGASVAPPSPVHAAVRVAEDGALAVTWMRRSRGGWAWIDGVDAPLGEETEAYRMTLESADGAVRTIETTVPVAHIPAADRGPGRTTIRIVQRGMLAMSAPAILTLDDGA